jgi:hypothetical protein
MNKFISLQQAAIFLGVSTQTLCRWEKVKKKSNRLIKPEADSVVTILKSSILEELAKTNFSNFRPLRMDASLPTIKNM